MAGIPWIDGFGGREFPTRRSLIRRLSGSVGMDPTGFLVGGSWVDGFPGRRFPDSTDLQHHRFGASFIEGQPYRQKPVPGYGRLTIRRALDGVGSREQPQVLSAACPRKPLDPVMVGALRRKGGAGRLVDGIRRRWAVDLRLDPELVAPEHAVDRENPEFCQQDRDRQCVSAQRRRERTITIAYLDATKTWRSGLRKLVDTWNAGSPGPQLALELIGCGSGCEPGCLWSGASWTPQGSMPPAATIRREPALSSKACARVRAFDDKAGSRRAWGGRRRGADGSRRRTGAGAGQRTADGVGQLASASINLVSSAIIGKECHNWCPSPDAVIVGPGTPRSVSN